MQVADLETLWSVLRAEADATQNPLSRVYRALGETALGVRASFVPAEEKFELLVEVPIDWRQGRTLPEWRGLRLTVLPDSFPPRETHQLSLALVDNDAWTVFLHIAADIATCLEGIPDSAQRIALVVDCLERWSRFFDRCATTGLSATAQRGLFAELRWLDHMLDGHIDPLKAVNAWKGCLRGYHDFDMSGDVVEVKSTMTKEPRRVWISNERQLDDAGLNRLHLFVVTLQITDGGTLLPAAIGRLRERLAPNPAAKAVFERDLVSAGYLDLHSSKYGEGYAVKAEELYGIHEGFPRITAVPEGVGNLRYSVVLGCCHSFLVNTEDYIVSIKEASDG